MATKPVENAAPPSIMSFSFLLPPDAVSLGLLVTEYKTPQTNCHKSDLHFKELVSHSDDFKAELTHFHSAFALTRDLISRVFSSSKCSLPCLSIEAERMTCHNLEQPDEWFRDAICNPSTKSWIDMALKDDKNVYMIVGYHIMTNANICQIGTSGIEEKFEAKGDHVYELQYREYQNPKLQQSHDWSPLECQHGISNCDPQATETLTLRLQQCSWVDTGNGSNQKY